MQLLLNRSQKKGLTGKSTYTLDVRANLSADDIKIVNENGLGNEVLVFHDKTGPTEGVAGAVLAAMKNTAMTVDTLTRGTTFKCKNVAELMGIENEVKDASVTLKNYIEAARHFGGEEVIDVSQLAEELA